MSYFACSTRAPLPLAGNGLPALRRLRRLCHRPSSHPSVPQIKGKEYAHRMYVDSSDLWKGHATPWTRPSPKLPKWTPLPVMVTVA